MKEQKSILMLDDDPTFLEATKVVLEGSGYRVITTTCPEDCFGKLKETKPDLIILDVMMVRDHTGFDVCRDLKRDPETKGIPILMLTAVDQKYPSFHFAEAAANVLTSDALDPIAKIPEYKVCAVRIEKLRAVPD